MNKTLKIIILILNVVTLGITIYWLKNEQKPEPLTVLITQIIILLGLIFENQIENVTNRNVKNNSTIDVKVDKNFKVLNEDIDNSEIKVRTK